jgi:GMP synthase (glutamine-hydrolysing)
MKALVIEHSPSEGPLRIGALLAERGVEHRTCAVHRGDVVPADLAPAELLVLMGGPMGVGDADRLPYLRAELALIKARLAAGGSVLGICLGSQLLAAAAGARVYPNMAESTRGEQRPVREVGWDPIDLLAPAEPLLAGLEARLPMFHWHGDTYDLPAGAAHLASTTRCRHQAFRLRPNQIGFQFHPEVDPATIARWVREDADYVRAACGPDGPQRILTDTERMYPAARPAWDRLLSNALSLMQ